MKAGAGSLHASRSASLRPGLLAGYVTGDLGTIARTKRTAAEGKGA